MRRSDKIYSLESAERLLDEVMDKLLSGDCEPLAYTARKFQQKIQREIATQYKEKAK